MKKLGILILLLGVVVGSQSFGASCPSVTFTPTNAVKLTGGSALIVTHPSTMWDGRFVSKLGMDAMVRYAKKKGIQVVYLQDENKSTANTYFFSDCNPTYWVASGGGEFSFDVNTPSHIYTVGGHWELCQRTTMYDLMDKWKNSPLLVDRTVTTVMDGIYTAGENFRQGDPYYSTYELFMSVINYGRPRSWPFPKLSLLESMGIIKDEKEQVSFLKRQLPPYSGFSRDYQIELYLNGKKEEVIRQGLAKNPPVLKFEYVNSVYVDGEPIPSHH